MNGVLVCAPSGSRKNIGDYIQSVAQAQFLKTTDIYIERESLKSFHSDENVNLVMNGWFMWHPEQFPPSSCINPLFVSFHLVPKLEFSFLTDESIAYLKRFEPIGTRDIGTKEILERHGIKAYFSGCLTTTLCLKYKEKSKSDNAKVVFVDPYYSIAGTRQNLFHFKEYIKDIYLTFKHWKKVNHFIDHFEYEYWTWYGRISRKIEKRINASVFYEMYKDLCEDEVLFSAEYITHNIPSNAHKTTFEWMRHAEALIRKYAKAKFVITSRIHCALPCLGVETPVIFISSEVLKGDSLRSSGRFGGLIDQLNVLEFDLGFAGRSTQMVDLLKSGKLSSTSSFENPITYKEYRDRMIETVRSFINHQSL